jgi:hypothetical protein
MANKFNRRPGGAPPPGQAPGGRPPLIPADPLPGWKAATQAAVLLGAPLALLFAAKVVLRKFFPELGY